MSARLTKLSRTLAACLAILLATASATSAQQVRHAGSLATPRIAPLPDQAWTDAHRTAVATFAEAKGTAIFSSLQSGG